MTIKITSTEWQAASSPVRWPLVAIGDIHGCADLLVALRAHLFHVQQRLTRRVYLGDYIDPHARREHAHDCADVLDQVALDLCNGAQVLVGNHDAFLMIALACGLDRPVPWEPGIWSEQRGATTAVAWGITPEMSARMSETALAREIWNRMSDQQKSVFQAARVFVEHDVYTFVHAGFHPNVPIGTQVGMAHTLECPSARNEAFHPPWMRFKTGTNAAPRGRVLIHGHMSTRRPFIGRKRISIDTGAKYGGPLTALEIVEDRLRAHQAWPAETDPARRSKDGMR